MEQGSKKPYHTPTLTEHGDAVKHTKGFGGKFWEILMPKPLGSSELEDDPE